MKIIFGLIFFTLSANAQLSLIPESFQPVPKLPANQNSHILNLPFNSQPLFSESQIQSLAVELDSQFKKALLPLNHPVPNCNQSPQIENYLLALQVSGNLEACSKLAASCLNKATRPKPFLIGALCESTRFNYSQADAFFELATKPIWKNSPDYAEALFQRSAYSLFGHHEDQVDGILSLMPQSSLREQKLWKGILQRVGEIDLGNLKKSDVDQFIIQKINSSAPSLKGLLLSLQIRIATRDSRHSDAINALINRANEIQNPLFWYYDGFKALYYGLDTNFTLSQKIYDVYNRYSHPWLSFPLETNTYNYSQIYSSICPNQLIQESTGQDFYSIKQALREGEITIEAALQKLDQLRGLYSQKADYLAAYAGLLALQGRHSEAFDKYWESHKLCPYYNRAHWGLQIEKRFFQYSNRPDYNSLLSKLDRELSGRQIPNEISTYILNWNSLGSDVQKHVAYGSRIWLPYMPVLFKNEMSSYIKYAFDLLSDSPGLKSLKDERIGGPNYPHDNRLWDDVRGVGGDHVVADLAEVYQTVQGDYNLLGHEMAHQFQFLMEKIYPKGLQCITSQYSQAKATGNFPDSYSAQNMEEHFAQGVTYYLVPTDSPSRFGLNQSWVEKNNRAQFDFVKSIDSARGDLNLVNCGI